MVDDHIHLYERLNRHESRIERIEAHMTDQHNGLRDELHALSLKVEQGIGAVRLIGWLAPILVGLVVAVTTVVVQKMWR